MLALMRIVQYGAEYGIWNMDFGIQYGKWDVECGTWNIQYGARHEECGAWRAWSMQYGEWSTD